MSKLEETNLLIDRITKVKELGNGVDNAVVLADMAKSLAMIADKLCTGENEDKNVGIDRANVFTRADILSKIRDDVHRNAEMHEDGDWYLRLEWVDEILDKYKTEGDE